MLIAGALSLTSWGLVLGVVALVGWWLQGRRRLEGGGRRQTIALGGQAALHVVEVDGRRLLVGTGPGAAPRLLTELRPVAEGEHQPPASSESWAGGDRWRPS